MSLPAGQASLQEGFDDVLGLEIPPGPRLIPEQGP